MIALEQERSLRIEPGTPVEIACVCGVLWVTQEGDVRDLFLARGESFRPARHGVTIVTALESSLVHLVERNGATAGWTGWRRVVRWMETAARALPRPHVVLPRVWMLKR